MKGYVISWIHIPACEIHYFISDYYQSIQQASGSVVRLCLVSLTNVDGLPSAHA